MRHACLDFVRTLQVSWVVQIEAFINGDDDSTLASYRDQFGCFGNMPGFDHVRNEPHPAEPAPMREKLVIAHISIEALYTILKSSMCIGCDESSGLCHAYSCDALLHNAQCFAWSEGFDRMVNFQRNTAMPRPEIN
ncbi:hypothetical protein NZ30_12705 [Xanthomonas translucens pv. undulosa]|nr:hypothetical protein NZ30_12705 [Xanthomonas translucens pv. undulosa]